MRSLLILCTILCASLVTAQEVIRPLVFDYAKGKETRSRELRSDFASRSSVGLPFIDDFSIDHFPGNADGNTVLWDDLGASRKFGFALAPPSIGTAVMDGLNLYGQPYDYGTPNTNGRADTLTSVEIDLNGSQDVVLSFLYQPAGYGDAPEGNDSLIVQFFDPSAELWSTVWHATGSPLVPFDTALIAVDEALLVDGFRFRFMNYGRLTGALDLWAVDWVYLDDNRTTDELDINDVGFSEQINTLLNNRYTSVPWKHYSENGSASNMLPSATVTALNNRQDNALITESGYEIFYDGTLQDDFVNLQSPSVVANTTIDFTQGVASEDIFYDPSIAENEAAFDVEFYFNTSPDIHADNNRMGFIQSFHDYYAYDDGVADNAYGIQNFNAAGRVALAYELMETDTILGFDMIFHYQAISGSSPEDQIFFLTIWEEDNTGKPDSDAIIYQDASPRSVQFDEEGEFIRYYLQEDTVILEAGTNYFFGWVQPDDISTNIGNDLSADLNSELLFFDVGFGWTQSSYPGVIMLRPVVNSPLDLGPISSIPDQEIGRLDVWPNPSQGEVLLSISSGDQGLFEIYDLGARCIKRGAVTQEVTRIDLSGTEQGVYLLVFTSEQGDRRIERIVIQD